MKAQPFNVFFDGIDVFVVFFFGVGVIETQVALPIKHIRQAEIQADGFGVSDVQVAVGLGGEAGVDGGVRARFEVVFDDGADEVVVGKLVFGQHGGLTNDFQAAFEL